MIAALCERGHKSVKRSINAFAVVRFLDIAVYQLLSAIQNCGVTMLAYIFWHSPFSDIDVREYEAALLDFHADLAAAPHA